MFVVVDTHALAWWLEGNPKLSATACAALEGCQRPLLVPVLVAAELLHMGKKRGDPARMRALFAGLRESDDLLILPLTEHELSLLSPELDLHDAIIVASALAYAARSGEAVTVLTKDERIAGCGLVETAW